ncbi:MAG TPA: hypothetical protein VGX25_25550 [Actinophytocola sp.]|uniref:hypothetical protein n=1 Tax=Actinophytocola sp. TaxID=1872138 RepID=UPI002DDCAFD4|nr:hypothetical protein [Actinophytocola sp.]HEV2782772.1 hypothetical protein [Actinophytocola sp.]
MLVELWSPHGSTGMVQAAISAALSSGLTWRDMAHLAARDCPDNWLLLILLGGPLPAREHPRSTHQAKVD